MNLLAAFVGLVLQVSAAQAQTNERTREISRAGEMFTLRYEPGNKKITLGLVGRPEAQVRWDKTELEVLSNFQGLTESHRVRKNTNSFTILDATNPKSELKVQIKSDGKQETITIPAQQ